MKNIYLLVFVLWSSTVMAKVINFEFKFTPFTGDPAKEDHVQAVPGKARVFLNNVPIAEQEVSAGEQPVLFDEREVGASVWVPTASVGSTLRKGKNVIKVEFDPADSKAGYTARLSWTEVNDQSSEETSGNTVKASNQSGEGMDNKEAHGKVTLEKEFVADFAADQPWHHYAPVTALTDADKQQLLALVNARAALFKPKFDGVYKLLDVPHPGLELDLGKMRQSACLDKAYKAGVRVLERTAADVDFVLSGSQEVVIKGKTGMLYPFEEKTFMKIKGDEAQMCVGLAVSLVYPPQLVVVKNAAGAWEVVY